MNSAVESRVGPTSDPARVDESRDAHSEYADALAWLYRLQRFGIKLGLENVHRLLAELRIDLANARVVHVAGTNGKGSVCAMIESICRTAGYRTGLFTSPHLVSFRERIQVDGQMVSTSNVAAGLASIRRLVEDWDPHPTFFEVTTALALKIFAGAAVEVLILETGLGGRLDATNAVKSNVAVITPIDLDHQKWLGNSIEEISTEKAGIIKPRVPVISAPQKKEVEDLLRRRAKECDSQIEFVTEPDTAHSLGLLGEYQRQNAALAIAALRKLDRNIRSSLDARKIDIGEEAIARGLATVQWPARFQKWDDRTIVDGAHNPAAAAILAETWRQHFGNQRATLILAILSDKDLPGICEALAPISDHIFLPKIRSERAAEPNDIAGCLSKITPLVPYSIASSIADALERAHQRPSPILITGSLHFAGEVLAFLRGEPAAFEECAQ